MDSILEKLGVYELFSIIFAGSVITYCSVILEKYYFKFGFSLNNLTNGLNKTVLFVLVSCFIGILFQEFGSIIINRLLFKNNKLLKIAYSSKSLSESEYNKLESIFNDKGINDLVEKYNESKYYILLKGNTSRADKEMALSSMSRSFFVYFFIISIALLLEMILNLNLDYMEPFVPSVILTIVMFFRLKRFANMRYVYIFRNYLYAENNRRKKKTVVTIKNKSYY